MAASSIAGLAGWGVCVCTANGVPTMAVPSTTIRILRINFLLLIVRNLGDYPKPGCPILGAYLFLRHGWESTNPNRPITDQTHHPTSTAPPFTFRISPEI